MTDQRTDILEASPETLAQWLEAHGEPPYRLGQILEWGHVCRVDSFDAMSNLPLELRDRLAESFAFPALKEVERLTSEDGATGKLLLELADGEQIESVWMDDAGRHTFCISSQAGCALGCVFCATGAAGFGRNLRLGEILGQVTALARATGELRNVVFMGMGEPLLNLDAVLPALESLADRRRFGLGARHLTVSTAGVPDGIRALSKSPARPNLALSLNSPFDEQRSELMPVNRRHPLDDVLTACEEYARRTSRRLLLEYVLIGGVNTSPNAAAAVAKIARKPRALVNLIAFNTVPGSGFRSPTRAEVGRFRAALEREGIAVTERYRRGRDISAACGQLKGKHPAPKHGGQVSACPDRRTPAEPRR